MITPSIVLSFPYHAEAQDGEPGTPQNELNVFTKIVPPSPDAGKLASYAEVPVSHFTGTANIEIPIFELKGKELTVPVKLSYKAGGIKVEETASGIGLGWSLIAGGVISRTVYGLPDEGDPVASSFFNNYDQLLANKLGMPRTIESCNAPNTIIGYKTFQDEVMKFKSIDVQPDIYFYNVNGLSGKLFLDQDGNPQTIPFKKYKITPGNGPLGVGQPWIIKTDDGDTYIFEAIERTRTDVSSQGEGFDTNKDYVSSWYLTQIISRNSADSFTFEYQPTPTQEIEVKSNFGLTEFKVDVYGSSMECAGLATGAQASPGPKMYVKQLFLSRITSNHGQEVVFDLASGRQDYVGALRYSSITVKESGKVIRAVSLVNNQYFGSGSETSKRLKLERVEVSFMTGSTPDIYRFEYNSAQLPDRLSHSQDLWGYARSSGMGPSSMIPQMEGFSGADRSSNLQYTKACNLEKIYYPTGGYKEFVYELNKVGENTVGGLRTKEIKLFDFTGQLLKRIAYRYEGTTINSATFKTGGSYKHTNCNNQQVYTCSTITRFSSNRSQVGGAAAFHVGYHLVEEEVRDLQDATSNGKTVYAFNAHSITSPYPYPPPSFSSATDLGLLLSKRVFDASGNILRSEEYSYQGLSSDNDILIPQTGYNAVTIASVTGLQLANKVQTSNLPLGWKAEGCEISYTEAECSPIMEGYSIVNWAPTVPYTFGYSSSWNKYPIGKVTRDYNGGSELITVEIYKYDNLSPLYPYITQKRISTSISDEILIEDKLFPFSSGYGTAPYTTMLTRNMITQTVELKQSILKAGVSTPTMAEKYTFSNLSGKILPTIYHVAGDGVTYLEETTDIQYDGLGNIVKMVQKGQPIAYLWSGLYLLVELKGGQAFKYEGFEDFTQNTSTTSKTGLKSYSGEYNVIPPSGTYTLTYWMKDGTNDWSFVKTTINSSTLIGGTNKLVDEVRVFPAGTSMTSYSHDYGVGMINSVDPNSRITYYEYDNKGRLWLVRDHDKNIVKQMKYHYFTED